MKRELSSSLTPVWKFIFPVAWISFMGIGGIWSLTKIFIEPFAIWMLGGWVLGSAFIYLFASRLKKVSIDDQYLYVSNYRKEIQIPLSGIERVKETFLTDPKHIMIFLRSPSEFGSKIVFTPQTRFLGQWRRHPVVKELREIIGRYSGV